MMLDRKSWDEFQASGLLWFVNSILHTFGWAIVVVMVDGEEKVWPARTTLRGFDPLTEDGARLALSRWMKVHAAENHAAAYPEDPEVPP